MCTETGTEGDGRRISIPVSPPVIVKPWIKTLRNPVIWRLANAYVFVPSITGVWPWAARMVMPCSGNPSAFVLIEMPQPVSLEGEGTGYVWLSGHSVLLPGR